MLLYELGLLLLLLPVCSFAPGFFFVRRLRWNPLEKLCASIALSLILLYLAAWAIYCAGPRGDRMPVHRAPFVIVSVAALAMGAFCWKDIGRLFRVVAVRRAMAGYGFLLLWAFLLMAIIRNYSGASWFGDWLEHFQRSLFFLQHFPTGTRIFPGYPLPARPPMMNVLAAFFMAQTADVFEVFQAIFVFLNLLLFLPCYMMMPALGKRARRRAWLLTLLFCASPLVMQNVTYTWTKSLAAFYVVLALWLYLAGWRKRDTVRMTAAFVSFAAGLLVHYSAGPYIAIVTIHYLAVVFPRRPDKWRELAAIAAICGLLVGVWLFWSLAVYGPHLTFASNTTVTSSKMYNDTTGKIVANLYDSIVPLVLRSPELLGAFAGQRTAGEIRDWYFVFYQVNAIFAMGLVGGPLVVWLLFRAVRRKSTAAQVPKGATAKVRSKRSVQKAPAVRTALSPERRFWLALTVFGLILGIAVVGERDPLGVAHLTLLSLQVLGLAMLAATIPWRRGTLLVAILAGCAVDFSLGVLLQAHVESLENTASSTVFPAMEFTGTTIQTAKPGPDVLSNSAWNNWFQKHALSAYDVWLQDLNRRYGAQPAYRAMLPGYKQTVERAVADDMKSWQGWFSHHDGEVVFLGDHVAAWSAVFEGLLVVLFVGLAAGVWLNSESPQRHRGTEKTKVKTGDH